MSAGAILLMAFAPLIVAAAAYLVAEFLDWVDSVVRKLLSAALKVVK